MGVALEYWYDFFKVRGNKKKVKKKRGLSLFINMEVNPNEKVKNK